MSYASLLYTVFSCLATATTHPIMSIQTGLELVHEMLTSVDVLIQPMLTHNTLFLFYSLSTYFVQKNWLSWQAVADVNNVRLCAVLMGTALRQPDIDNSYATREVTVE